MNIRKPRVGALHVQEESRAFALLRQVLEELTRRHLLPTPGHYAVIFRRLVARQRGEKNPDAQTFSELVLCAHLVDALRGNFTESGWLSVQLKQLRNALGDESAEPEEEEEGEMDMRIQRIESIIHSIAMNTARSLGDTQDFSQDCRRLMEALQTEVGSAIRTVSGADDAISDCSARLQASQSLEEGRMLFSELTQHVGQVSSQLRRTELMLGETNRNLTTAMEQLEKSQLQVRELAYAAQHDPLTGALNRLGLENALSLCASSELTIILFGIDDFADISLKHGTWAKNSSNTPCRCCKAGCAMAIWWRVRKGRNCWCCCRACANRSPARLPTVCCARWKPGTTNTCWPCRKRCACR